MLLICHPGHALARRQKIRLADLDGEKFIGFEPDQPTRKVIDRHLRAQAVRIKHVMEFDNIETVKRAVEIASGVSIVPAYTVRQEVESGLLCAVPIENPKISRPLGIVSKRNRARSPAHQEFVAALKKTTRAK